jgi:hypothetical protein
MSLGDMERQKDTNPRLIEDKRALPSFPLFSVKERD